MASSPIDDRDKLFVEEFYRDLSTGLDKVTLSAGDRDQELPRQAWRAQDTNTHLLFNIKANKYRLITEINYRYQRLYIRQVLTHAEYDQEKWKQ